MVVGLNVDDLRAISLFRVSHITKWDNTVRIFWQLECKMLSARVVSDHDETVYHLIAEELPRSGKWDRVVWRDDAGGGDCQYGVVVSSLSAMETAQEAARGWDRDRVAET